MKKTQSENERAARPYMIFEVRRAGRPLVMGVFCRTEQNRDLPPVRYGVQIDEDGNSRRFGPVRGRRNRAATGRSVTGSPRSCRTPGG